MGWETRFQNNDPSYLEPRISNAESSLADNAKLKNNIVIDVTDKKYGAKGDGLTDDTTAIQSALNDAGLTGGAVLIPPGTYMINAVTNTTDNPTSGGISVPSNVSLIISKNASLKAITNNSQTYAVIRLYNVTNVTISGGGTIQGERTTHTGTGGEWGFGIAVIGSSNIVIRDITTKDCWGDGLFVTGLDASFIMSTNILIENVVSTNNRRNGLSIVSADGVRVLNSDFTNQNGTAPQTGIDVEPNSYHVTNNMTPANLIFENLNLSGNTGSGLSFVKKSTNSKVINCRANNNLVNGFWLNGVVGTEITRVTFLNCAAISNTGKGFHAYASNFVRFVSCHSELNSSYGIYAQTANQVIITKSFVFNNSDNGILVSWGVTNVNVSDNYVANNTSASTQAQIFLLAGSGTVVGGIIKGNQIISTVGYGIDLGSNAISKIIVKDNDFTNFTGTNRIHDNSDGTCTVDLGFDVAAPTTGTHMSKGTIMHNSNISVGGVDYWELTTGGTPGVWTPKQIGVMTSIAATPSFVGQFAVVGGIAYMATGTSATTDWKQIS